MTFGVATMAGSDSAGIAPVPSMTWEFSIPGSGGGGGGGGSGLSQKPSSGISPGTQARMSRTPSFQTTLLGSGPVTSNYSLFMFEAPWMAG